MKKLTILETSIIGFFLGVVVGAYLVFLTGTDGFIGQVISGASLMPIFHMISIPENVSLIASFVFIVAVYTIYGALVGAITRKYSKAGLTAISLVLILIAVSSLEQVKGAATHVSTKFESVNFAAAMVSTRPKTPAPPQQYFGNEVLGDLNGDQKDDVAFLITRNDQDRGMLYYLVSALTFDGGRVGTNLIFVGEQIRPSKIFIENGLIGLEYMSLANKLSTTTSVMYAHVTDGILEKTDKIGI